MREWWPSPVKLIRTEEGEVELLGHESTSINEQGPPENPSQDEEAGRAESVNSRDSSTETLLTPVENLWALLEGEREANRDLRQEVQRLKRSVAELTAAGDSIADPRQPDLAMMLERERDANRALRLRLSSSLVELAAANTHLDSGGSTHGRQNRQSWAPKSSPSRTRKS